MTVAEVLDIMNISHDNKIVLYDLDENAGGAETVVELADKGWFKQPVRYKEFAKREVYGIHLHGKTIRISMS